MDIITGLGRIDVLKKRIYPKLGLEKTLRRQYKNKWLLGVHNCNDFRRCVK